MNPMLIAPLLQAGVGLGQSIYGMSQLNAENPEYEIPESQKSALSLQRAYASQKLMPAQELMQGNIQQNQANVMASMKEQGISSPASLAALQESTNEAYQGLGARAAAWQTGEKDKLLGQLGTMAGYEDKQWDWNVARPYQEQTAAGSSMLGAGMQNVMGSASSFGEYAGAQKYRDWMEELYNPSGTDGAKVDTSDPFNINKSYDTKNIYDTGNMTNPFPYMQFA